MMAATRSWLMIAGTILIVTAPLVIPGLGGEFGGSDDQASQAIKEVVPDFQPWAEPLWEPPSGEVESMLFALQAALGAGIIGYVIGRRRSRRKSDVAD